MCVFCFAYNAKFKAAKQGKCEKVLHKVVTRKHDI